MMNSENEKKKTRVGREREDREIDDITHTDGHTYTVMLTYTILL